MVDRQPPATRGHGYCRPARDRHVRRLDRPPGRPDRLSRTHHAEARSRRRPRDVGRRLHAWRSAPDPVRVGRLRASEGAIGAHAETQVSAYLVLVAMSLAYWQLLAMTGLGEAHGWFGCSSPAGRSSRSHCWPTRSRSCGVHPTRRGGVRHFLPWPGGRFWLQGGWRPTRSGTPGRDPIRVSVPGDLHLLDRRLRRASDLGRVQRRSAQSHPGQ